MNITEKMKLPDKVNDVAKNSGAPNILPPGPGFSPHELNYNYIHYYYIVKVTYMGTQYYNVLLFY